MWLSIAKGYTSNNDQTYPKYNVKEKEKTISTSSLLGWSLSQYTIKGLTSIFRVLLRVCVLNPIQFLVHGRLSIIIKLTSIQMYIDETMINTKTYNKKNSPLILNDLSETAGLSLPKKMQASCLAIVDNQIYVGTKNSRVFIYTFDQKNFTKEIKIVANYKVISSITISSQYFVLAPEAIETSTFSVWDKKTNKFQIALTGHTSQVSSVLFLEDEDIMATSSWDGTIKLWILQPTFSKDFPIDQFKDTGYPIICMKVFKQTVLVFGDDECYITFWDWKKKSILEKVLGHGGSVTTLLPLSPFLLSGGGDHIFKLLQKVPKKSQNKDEEQMENQISNANLKDEEKEEQEHFETISSFGFEYDSRIFDIEFEKERILMDYQGRIFLLKWDQKELLEVGNPFQYNENVVGLVKYEQFLIVATTKSALRLFECFIKNQQS